MYNPTAYSFLPALQHKESLYERGLRNSCQGALRFSNFKSILLVCNSIQALFTPFLVSLSLLQHALSSLSFLFLFKTFMLRRFGFGRSSSLEVNLTKPNVKLEDLFDDTDQLLQEIHLQNPRLISLYVLPNLFLFILFSN